MLHILQSLFIIILTPVSKVTSKLSDKVRNAGIQTMCFLLVLLFLYRNLWRHALLYCEPLISFNARHILGCFLLLLLVIVSLDRVPQHVNWNKWLMYPMIISGLGMLCISFIHPVGDGHRAFAMMLIFGFPCVYFVWNNRKDYERLFDPLARALAITGLIALVISFYCASIGDFLIVSGRCAGFTGNANYYSMTGMYASCGALYMLIKERAKTAVYLFYSAALGAGYAIVLLGQSRTSLLVCIFCLLVAIIFYCRHVKKGTKIEIAVRFLGVICLVIIMVCASNLCVEIQKTLEDNGVVPKTSTESTASDSAVDRFTIDKGETMNAYSAGRFTIWKGYMHYFNILGNDINHANWEVLTPNGEKRAHNNFVEMAFIYGVPIGIIFIIIEIVACLKMLQLLFINPKKQIVSLMPVLITVMYFFESMLDIALLPFEACYVFCFYMALIPMVDKSFNEDC